MLCLVIVECPEVFVVTCNTSKGLAGKLTVQMHLIQAFPSG